MSDESRSRGRLRSGTGGASAHPEPGAGHPPGPSPWTAAPRGQPHPPDAPRNQRRRGTAPPRSGSRPSGKIPTALGLVLGAALGAGVLAALSWSGGCGSEPAPGRDRAGPGGRVASTGAPRASTGGALPGTSTISRPGAAASATPDAGAADASSAAYDGPWLGAMAQATPVYATTRFADRWLGYVRRGGKVPTDGRPVKTKACPQGWYELGGGGYVCGKYATLDLDNPRVRLGVKPPDLAALLPYRYAYNTAHGTPLYRSVPAREEMIEYEPYLKLAKEAQRRPNGQGEPDDTAPPPGKHADKGTEQAAHGEAPEGSSAPGTRPRRPDAIPSGAGETAAPGPGPSLPHAGAAGAGPAAEPPPPPGGEDEAAAEEELPWWQRSADAGPPQVTLAELDEGGGTLAKRMVKGFFVAIDQTFAGTGRLWYRTTSGLIAPADRMVIPKTPDLHGMEMASGVRAVGFVRNAPAHRYGFAEGGKVLQRLDRVERFTAIGLTGETRAHAGKRYRETLDGWWMREIDGTYTEPGPAPEGLAADEKWIDVNLTLKTLVAFEGERPVYAALVAPGKHSTDKKRDHRTPTGKFRIREKHISTTMDGEGIAGDMPYSIEDVPYVMYYDRSYALHGAFWHSNFGREQSHGCVNLSPADAKHLFFWTDPVLPRGWHGVWATEKSKGTLVVIHE
ncbi:MAG: L,D-transpeptidase family protein [Deltaproteobacteria bacterium]|nr:L,D-transpeptidase family protein [Deltaproteobacteria bacterium]